MTITDAVRNSPDPLPAVHTDSLAKLAAQDVAPSSRCSSAHRLCVSSSAAGIPAWDVDLGIKFFGRSFDALGDEWRTLSTIPTPADRVTIDHLIVGPAGVFTISVDPMNISETKFAARRAATLLSGKARFDVEVQPIAALTWPMYSLTMAAPNTDAVTMLRMDEVVEHLRALPVVLGRPSIERIYAVARHLTTWQPKSFEAAGV